MCTRRSSSKQAMCSNPIATTMVKPSASLAVNSTTVNIRVTSITSFPLSATGSDLLFNGEGSLKFKLKLWGYIRKFIVPALVVKVWFSVSI